MKLNTGPYSAENNPCNWYCLSSVSLLFPEDINTILKGKISPFQQPQRRLLDVMIIPHSRAAVLLSVIAEKVMPVHAICFSWAWQGIRDHWLKVFFLVQAWIREILTDLFHGVVFQLHLLDLEYGEVCGWKKPFVTLHSRNLSKWKKGVHPARFLCFLGAA